MQLQALLISALAALSLAAPLTPRAGGPAFLPITNCTTTNALPATNTTDTGVLPNSTFVTTHQIYSIYLSEPDFQTPDDRWTGCLEQCHGLSGCESVLMGYDAPTPKGWYGTSGGVKSVACLFFDTGLEDVEWVAAGNGTWSGERAAGLSCPAS